MSGKSSQRAIEGVMLDPDFLPAVIRQQLLDQLISSPLNATQKAAFIAYTSNMTQSTWGDQTEYATRKKQLEKVARAADALQMAIEALSDGAIEAIEATEDHCRFSSKPPIELAAHVLLRFRTARSSLLGDATDWVGALRATSHHAASRIKADRGSRPQQHFSRALVSILAQWVVDETGAPPPGDRSGWFAGYVDALGTHLDVPMGPRVVDGALKATAHTSQN